MTDDMTPERAELIMKLAATTIDTASSPEFRDLHWLHSVAAMAIACRGMAATAMARDPALSLDDARFLMTREFVRVMGAPAELVRTVKTDDEDARTTVIPVRKH